MISAMQSDSAEAVEAMSKSKELATQSLDVAQEASTSLDQIAKAITQINERNTLIATASEEQAHVAREVDRNLVSIRELAVQSSAGASQTASACGEMSKLAVDLNRMVSRFVV
jgi:methyl-accepting chemotaxis protein